VIGLSQLMEGVELSCAESIIRQLVAQIYSAILLRKRCNMNQSPIPEPNLEPAKPRPGLIIFLVLATWILLVAGGYYAGKLYIDQSIAAVQQDNAVHMITIEQQIESLDAQIYEIQQALNNADQSWASSGTTQENLNQKIEALDKQLKSLEQSLNILREAP